MKHCHIKNFSKLVITYCIEGVNVRLASNEELKNLGGDDHLKFLKICNHLIGSVESCVMQWGFLTEVADVNIKGICLEKAINHLRRASKEF